MDYFYIISGLLVGFIGYVQSEVGNASSKNGLKKHLKINSSINKGLQSFLHFKLFSNSS